MEYENKETVRIRDQKLCVKIPMGTLIAYSSCDPEYPGIYIDLQREGFEEDSPLALVEYTETEADLEPQGHIISRIWGNVSKEDYSNRIVHKGFEMI